MHIPKRMYRRKGVFPHLALPSAMSCLRRILKIKTILPILELRFQIGLT